MIFKKGDYRGKRRFWGFSSLWSRDLSKIAIFAKIRENFAPPVQLHLSRTPFFPSAIFFRKFHNFYSFSTRIQKENSAFRWMEFAATVFQSSSREKSEEQKLGSAFCRKGFFPNQTLRVLALTMVNGQVIFFGVFLRIPFGKNTFCDLHFFLRKIRIRFFEKSR